MQILDIRDTPELMDDAVLYLWKQWGNQGNFDFYIDCILHSSKTKSEIPRFFLAIEDGNIIGSYALLRSDLNRRLDLSPWLACLCVSPEARGRRIGVLLQTHAINQAKKKGYSKLYLHTELTGYFERSNWRYEGKGYSICGQETKIYEYRIEGDHPREVCTLERGM